MYDIRRLTNNKSAVVLSSSMTILLWNNKEGFSWPYDYCKEVLVYVFYIDNHMEINLSLSLCIFFLFRELYDLSNKLVQYMKCKVIGLIIVGLFSYKCDV